MVGRESQTKLSLLELSFLIYTK